MHIKQNILSVLIVAGLFTYTFSSCKNSNAEESKIKLATVEEAASVEDNNTISTESNTTKVDVDNDGKVRKINTETFIAEVFDYKANPQAWVYKGTKPAIIDFYADWCGPCKKVAPIMDELAKEYKGEINFYKINTDHDKELSGGVFGIRSIPSILFIPLEGQPSMQPGLLTKEQYTEIINTNLLKK